MLREAREELLCDFAEYYHIYDLRDFSVQYIAILAKGLRNESRVKMKLSNTEITFDRLALATLIDGVNLLIWQNTKSGRNGKHRPKSVAERLIKKETEESEVQGFLSIEDFERTRARLIGGGENA